MVIQKKHRERKLPVQQLAILVLCRFSEPIAATSLLPYLPEMIESLNVPQSEVGKWAGICSAVFSLAQAATGVIWGRLSDRYGRKYVILLGIVASMLTLLLWGFTSNLTMAIIVRILGGAANGDVGIMRTTVAEMVPFKELQPFAFSLMPLVWNVGSSLGPVLGGALANPYNVRPDERRYDGSLLEAYPYLLPNLVSASFFTVGIIAGFLFLEETMEGARDKKDCGRILGRKLANSSQLVWKHVKNLLQIGTRLDESASDGETEPLLESEHIEDEENGAPASNKPVSTLPPPTWSEVLNKETIKTLIAYTMLSCHTMAFDQLVPVYMQYPIIFQPGSTPYTFPLKFAGGFGLDHFTIGVVTTVNGIVGMVFQFFAFPPLARKYGPTFWMKIVAVAYPIAYLLIPFTALLPTDDSRIGCLLVLMILKTVAGTFAFPCNTIILTNSATSLRTLGTLNGIATSAAALGRAAGPATAGAMFSLGVKTGYIIAPWWLICAFSLISAIPMFFLVEGKGFASEEDEEHDEDVHETLGQLESEETLVASVVKSNGNLNATALEDAVTESQAAAAGAVGPLIAPENIASTPRSRP